MHSLPIIISIHSCETRTHTTKVYIYIRTLSAAIIIPIALLGCTRLLSRSAERIGEFIQYISIYTQEVYYYSL